MYRPIKCCIIIFISLFITSNCAAQADSVDRFIQNVMQERGIPGLQLAIVQHGKIVKTGNYGLANVQDSIAVSDRTVFPINSITKAFTGVAIMQLVEAGKLSLDEPVGKYLQNLPKAWLPVTIQQLLSHTSGIPDIVDEEESVLISPGLDLAWSKVTSLPMDFLPGERFRYNQTNYLLLGRIIDTLSGMPFTDFIKKEQLAKAGMRRTTAAGFGASMDVIKHAAASYTYRRGKLANMFFSFPPSLQTAAGMSATAAELGRWLIALQRKELLKTESAIQTLWKPALLNNGKTAGFSDLLNGYAAGWPVISRPEHPAVAPVGGGRSALFVYPKDDFAVVVLTNLAGSTPDAFIDEIAGFYFPDMKAANGFGFSENVKKIRKALENKGYNHAIAIATSMCKNPDFILPEKELNSWGYKLLKSKRVTDALEIFKLNVYLYPESSNAFDSLGEIYGILDDKANAIKNYERSVHLDGGNSHAIRQLQILRSNK